jgi:hypothetical protein
LENAELFELCFKLQTLDPSSMKGQWWKPEDYNGEGLVFFSDGGHFVSQTSSAWIINKLLKFGHFGFFERFIKLIIQ